MRWSQGASPSGGRASGPEAPRQKKWGRGPPGGGAGPPPPPPPPAGAALFERLRAWRAAEAKLQSVPPYVIFHDSVLRDIASLNPRDAAALGTIKGVGASKLERYGDKVLAQLG